MPRLLGLVFAGTLVAGVALAASTGREAYRRPLTIPFPDSAPYDPQIATLGKMLYFDPRLSGAQNMSCASCHNPSFGWEAPVDRAVGAANVPLGRHAPTIINAAWVEPLFWDGRAPNLEEQAAGPITASVEMNAQFDQVIARLGRVEEYDLWFNRLFPGQGMTRETILRAIATYERTVVSGWSPFDRWVDGDESALTDSEKRGFELFTGRALCADCHIGWNFSDNDFHDIGLPSTDLGLGAREPDNPKAQHAFKTPGLRNVALRAPYMHDGSLSTLQDVLSHYQSGGIERASLSSQMQAMELSDQDVTDLVAFLGTLTESATEVPTPILPAN